MREGYVCEKGGSAPGDAGPLVAYYLIALHSQHTLADESIPSNHVQLGKIQFDSVARQKHTHIAVLVLYYY